MSHDVHEGLEEHEAPSTVFDRISMQCVEIDAGAGRLRLANAGHPAPVLYSAKRRASDRLTVMGPLFDRENVTTAYRARSAEISEGDVLVLVSDGLTEGGRLQEPYGYRFTSILEHLASASAQAIAERILDDWRAHPRSPEWIDDVTVVVGRPPIGGVELACVSRRGTEVVVWPSVPEGGEADVGCAILRSPTYDDEYVRLVIGTTLTITVERRLDLFASEVVTRVWHLLPPPRRVIFEVAQSQYTEAGLQPLLDLCAISDESNRGAIVITGVTDQSRHSLPQHPAIHDGSSGAESALRLSGRQLPRLQLRARRA